MRLTKLIPFVLLLLAACEGGKSTPPVPKIETTTFNPALGVDLAHSVKLPSGMYYRDTTIGTGTVVTAGDVLQTYYVGMFPDGSVFDSRRTGDQPYIFQIGITPPEAIGGWDQGLIGIAEGGQRQLIIPPDLGYGEKGIEGFIPGNSILVFNVAVLKVTIPEP